MKTLLPFMVAAVAVAGAGLKPLPGQAGNDDIELVGSVLVERAEIQQAVGADLGEGYIVVRMKASPKTEKPLRVGPDDFTMISRKDGQRSQALAPSQIAGGGGAIIVTPVAGNGHSGGSVGVFGAGLGASPGVKDERVDSKVVAPNGKPAESPLLAALSAKLFPDKESKEPIEGLLYFPIDGKVKPKDIAVIYKGPAGKLIMEFQNPKR